MLCPQSTLAGGDQVDELVHLWCESLCQRWCAPGNSVTPGIDDTYLSSALSWLYVACWTTGWAPLAFRWQLAPQWHQGLSAPHRNHFFVHEPLECSQCISVQMSVSQSTQLSPLKLQKSAAFWALSVIFTCQSTDIMPGNLVVGKGTWPLVLNAHQRCAALAGCSLSAWCWCWWACRWGSPLVAGERWPSRGFNTITVQYCVEDTVNFQGHDFSSPLLSAFTVEEETGRSWGWLSPRCMISYLSTRSQHIRLYDFASDAIKC